MNPQALKKLKKKDLIYLKKKNIQGIFQEILAKLLQDRPDSSDDIKLYIIKQLKTMKMDNKIEYFEETDFELIYDTLNILKEEEIPINYLLKGLDMIGCKYNKNILLSKHKLASSQTIKKRQFVKVLKREYNKMITINLVD